MAWTHHGWYDNNLIAVADGDGSPTNELQTINEVNDYTILRGFVTDGLAAKGDTWHYDGTNVRRVTAGANESFLIYDSAQTYGIRQSNDPTFINTATITAKFDDLIMRNNFTTKNLILKNSGNLLLPDAPDNPISGDLVFSNTEYQRKICLYDVTVSGSVNEFHGLGVDNTNLFYNVRNSTSYHHFTYADSPASRAACVIFGQPLFQTKITQNNFGDGRTDPFISLGTPSGTFTEPLIGRASAAGGFLTSTAPNDFVLRNQQSNIVLGCGTTKGFTITTSNQLLVKDAPSNAGSDLVFPNTTNTRKITLFDAFNDEHRGYHIGVDANGLRTTVADTGRAFNFRHGTGVATSELTYSLGYSECKLAIPTVQVGYSNTGHIRFGAPNSTQEPSVGIVGANGEYFSSSIARDMYIRQSEAGARVLINGGSDTTKYVAVKDAGIQFVGALSNNAYINAYCETTESLTFSASNWQGSPAVNVNIVRLNNLVTINLSIDTGSLISAPGQLSVISTTAISAQYRPATARYSSCVIIHQGAYYTGYVIINTSGVIQFDVYDNVACTTNDTHAIGSQTFNYRL